MANRILEKVVTKLEMDGAISNLIDSYTMLSVTMGLDYKKWYKGFPQKSKKNKGMQSG